MKKALAGPSAARLSDPRKPLCRAVLHRNGYRPRTRLVRPGATRDDSRGMKLSRTGIGRPRIRRQARLNAWAEGVSVRVRGAAFELRRRLRPAARAASRPLRWIAPKISRALFVALGLPAALIAAGLDLFLRLARAV